MDRGDIDVLIEDASEQLTVVREMYDETLRAQKVPRKLMARIKNVVENQRSVLEYLAHAIYEQEGDGSGKKAFYPITTRPSEFRLRFERCLPGVAAHCPAVRDAIEARQAYQIGNEWLKHLALLTNENKHRRLTPQMRSETKKTRFESGGAAIELGEGASIRLSGGADVVLGGKSIRKIEPQEIVYVDWLFEDPPLSVLRTLQQIQNSLPSLIDDVSAVLPQ